MELKLFFAFFPFFQRPSIGISSEATKTKILIKIDCDFDPGSIICTFMIDYRRKIQMRERFKTLFTHKCSLQVSRKFLQEIYQIQSPIDFNRYLSDATLVVTL